MMKPQALRGDLSLYLIQPGELEIRCHWENAGGQDPFVAVKLGEALTAYVGMLDETIAEAVGEAFAEAARLMTAHLCQPTIPAAAQPPAAVSGLGWPAGAGNR